MLMSTSQRCQLEIFWGIVAGIVDPVALADLLEPIPVDRGDHAICGQRKPGRMQDPPSVLFSALPTPSID